MTIDPADADTFTVGELEGTAMRAAVSIELRPTGALWVAGSPIGVRCDALKIRGLVARLL